MQIIDLDESNIIFNVDAITFGNFDGFHLAHQKLINKCLEFKTSGVLLFKNHTLENLQNDNFKYILSTQDKIDILEKMNVDYCFVKSFDKSFSSLDPIDFLKYIKSRTNFSNLIVGKDSRFGINASGSVEDLQKLSNKFDYKLYILDNQFSDNVEIRSTTIRNYITNGNIEKANNLLFRPYSIKGTVINGKHRGRNLGFPTANITSNGYILPYSAVYYTNVIYNSKVYKGITSVGENLTYSENDMKIETNLLDFKGDLYGKELILVFLKKIRENVKFNSENELIENLKNDYNFAKNQILDLQYENYMVK